MSLADTFGSVSCSLVSMATREGVKGKVKVFRESREKESAEASPLECIFVHGFVYNTLFILLPDKKKKKNTRHLADIFFCLLVTYVHICSASAFTIPKAD